MSDYHYLIGADDVKNASHEIARAAETISRTTIPDPFLIDRLDQITARFVDAVDRFEQATQKLIAALPSEDKDAKRAARRDRATRRRRRGGVMRWCFWRKRTRPRRTGTLGWIIGPVTVKGKRRSELSLVLTDEQKVGLAIQPLTAAGNPAQVDGAPSWSVTDPGVLELEVESDGMSATVTTVGPLGTCQVQCVADADLGEGVTQITALLDVEVKAAGAATLSLTAGIPELK